MRRLTLREWLGSSVCAAVLMAGCNQAQRQPAYSTRPMGSVAMLPGYTPGTVFTTTASAESAAPKPAMVSSLPAPAANETNSASEQIKTVADKPTEVTAPINVAPTQTKEVESIPTVTKSADSEMTPAGYAVPVSGGKEEMTHRRSYADITAKPCFAHAPDYSWVQGELVYLHGRNLWRIRYASVDEEDKYGGGINLIEAGPMDNFQDGQLVRIEGRPADPDNKESEYRVNSIHALPNQ
jgi:hypothetical protein